jgi:hypothetical protein
MPADSPGTMHAAGRRPAVAGWRLSCYPERAV